LFGDLQHGSAELFGGGDVLGMYGPPRDCKGKFGREDKSAQMYSAFWWRWSPGHDELRAYLSF
jgi:hypothetical protein